MEFMNSTNVRKMNQTVIGMTQGAGNNGYLLKNDYLCKKIFEFVTRYNQMLYEFQQENDYKRKKPTQHKFLSDYLAPSLSSRKRSFSLLNKNRGHRPRYEQIQSQMTDVMVPENPLQIYDNTKKLQMLALMQVISITAVSNLDFIIAEPPHCFDRVL